MRGQDSRRAVLNYIGIAILLAGLATGEFIYWRSLGGGKESSADADALVLMADSKAHDYQVQVNVGTFGAILFQCEQALEKLGGPGPLAITISVVSIAAAGVCFLVASRMPRH